MAVFYINHIHHILLPCVYFQSILGALLVQVNLLSLHEEVIKATSSANQICFQINV